MKSFLKVKLRNAYQIRPIHMLIDTNNSKACEKTFPSWGKKQYFLLGLGINSVHAQRHSCLCTCISANKSSLP